MCVCVCVCVYACKCLCVCVCVFSSWVRAGCKVTMGLLHYPHKMKFID